MSYRQENVTKVYVGNLGNNASRSELEDEFSYYGKLVSVWVARNPPGFAYVLFEDYNDAKDAVRGLDGKTICDRRVKVDLSNSYKPRNNPRAGGGYGGDRGGGSYGGRGGGGGGFGGRIPNHEKTCYSCNRVGHISRDCPKFRKLHTHMHMLLYEYARYLLCSKLYTHEPQQPASQS